VKDFFGGWESVARRAVKKIPGAARLLPGKIFQFVTVPFFFCHTLFLKSSRRRNFSARCCNRSFQAVGAGGVSEGVVEAGQRQPDVLTRKCGWDNAQPWGRQRRQGDSRTRHGPGVFISSVEISTARFSFGRRAASRVVFFDRLSGNKPAGQSSQYQTAVISRFLDGG
jgi:hypothetical protein